MKLVVPAPANEIADHERLASMAVGELPLSQLECRADNRFTNPNKTLYFEYCAPPGKAIRALGRLTMPGSDEDGNPDIQHVDEFVGYALVYAIRNLDRGGSVHGHPKEHEPPPKQRYVYVHPFASSSHHSDLPRPSVQVTIVGRPFAQPSLTSGELKYFETDNRKFAYIEEIPVYQIGAAEAHGDITDIELEVIDDPEPPSLVTPDFSFVEMVKSDVWLPRGVEGVGTTEDHIKGYIDRGEIDPNDHETIQRVREILWDYCRYKRGVAMEDDPYPESARLRLATTTDNEGNNARLYGPYEGLSVNDDLGHIYLPNGDKRVVRVMTSEEFERRRGLNWSFRQTGWNVWGGRE